MAVKGTWVYTDCWPEKEEYRLDSPHTVVPAAVWGIGNQWEWLVSLIEGPDPLEAGGDAESPEDAQQAIEGWLVENLPTVIDALQAVLTTLRGE